MKPYETYESIHVMFESRKNRLCNKKRGKAHGELQHIDALLREKEWARMPRITEFGLTNSFRFLAA